MNRNDNPARSFADSSRKSTVISDGEPAITLGLLNAVEENSSVTQRSMAGELGIALGLANAYLKRCVTKGLIKVSQAPANRYAYYLTPKGFAEKSRLTADYLSISFNFFRAARRECSAVFADCASNDWRGILLFGGGDLAEIATLCASDCGVELVGVVDPLGAETSLSGIPVVSNLKHADQHEAIVITDMNSPQEIFDFLIEIMPTERVLAPRLLNVSRIRPNLAK